jgi:hypothetical protein
MPWAKHISENTSRHPHLGLVTRATPKFSYARVTLNGRIHIVSAVFFRWDEYPHPKVTVSTACGGRQYTRIQVMDREQFPAEECCIKCFKLDNRTTLRALERRESIIEAIEEFDGEFTIRDVWQRAHGHYQLTCLVMMELREQGLVCQVSAENTLPKRFMRVDRLTSRCH